MAYKRSASEDYVQRTVQAAIQEAAIQEAARAAVATRLDGEAAYPAWDAETAYADETVSHNGLLWHAAGTVEAGVEPPEEPWEPATIGGMLAGKQAKLTFDTEPTAGSPNPVTSGAVRTALQDKVDKSEMSATPGPGADKMTIQLKSGTSVTVLTAHQDVSDKADKSEMSVTPGPGADKMTIQLKSGTGATVLIAHQDISGKASFADLPYEMATPGEWEFSGVSAEDNPSLIFVGGSWHLYVDGVSFDSGNTSISALSVDIDTGGLFGIVTATRASLPGHLFDRAVNAVPVSSATGITLPEKIAGGKSRDFYVRLTVSAESAVTFAATDSGGDAVAWDSMGNPSGTFAAGTYLYRLTEVADGVFHAADITDGGSIDPAVLDEKLDASSAAPPFSESLTYLAGEYVTYGGVLYRCKTAVTVAGAWTGTSNWEADDMTSPDATLDVMSDGRLRVVTVAGEDLWMQGYDLEYTSAQALKCDKVNLLKFSATAAEAFDSTVAYAVGDSVVYGGMVYKFTAAHSAGAWVGTDAAVDSVSLTMPYVPVGKVGDFVLDVDNSANASVKMMAELSGLFTAFDVFVDKGRNLSDLLTFGGGEQCELYFTMTAFGTQAKPAWKVVKQVVEKQEAGS